MRAFRPTEYGVVLLTISVALSASIGCGEKASNDRPPVPPNPQAQQAWQDLSQAKPPESYASYSDPAGYWFDTLEIAHGAFWSAAKEPNSDDTVRYLVQQFDPDRPQESFRLLFCDIRVMLPSPRPTAPSATWSEQFAEDPNAPSVDRFDQVRTLVARTQTEMLLRDRRRRAGYCHAVYWYGLLRPDLPVTLSGWFRETGRLFAGSSDLEYWLAARSFVVLAHVTGREDLLEGRAADDLKVVYDQWWAWLEPKLPRLDWDAGDMVWRVGLTEFLTSAEGRRPTLPWPRWQGTPPPSPALIEAISAMGFMYY